MKLKRIAFFLIFALLLWLLPHAVLAGDDPLSLESSSIMDGQTKVPVNVEIELVFSNNVINQSVADNNVKCIKLMKDGVETSIDIVMADDQVQPDLKRIIKVKPKENLQQGQKYQLIVSGQLTSKNGNKMGEDRVISFTTEGSAQYIFFIIGGVLLIIILIFIVIRRKYGRKKKN